MRSWVSSAPPKIGRMSQSSRASKPSKSCEHNCGTQSNTIVELFRLLRTPPSSDRSDISGALLENICTTAPLTPGCSFWNMLLWESGSRVDRRRGVHFVFIYQSEEEQCRLQSRDPPESNFIFYWRWKESDHWAQIGKSQVNWDLNPSLKSNIIWAWIICFKNRFTCSSQWPLWHSDCVWILNYRQESKPKSKVA